MEEKTDFDKLEEYFKKAQSDSIEFKGFCHDCNKSVTVQVDVLEDATLKVTGGAVYFPNDKVYCKCGKCFEKDPTLRNYQPVDVYSRVVGFYRPINSWNDGKQSEWKHRKNYELPKAEALEMR